MYVSPEFSIFNLKAEFEKEIIRERVIAGLNNARHKGKTLGRPAVLVGVIEKAKSLRGKGLSFRKIGRELEVDEGMVRKRIKNDY